MLIGYIQFHFEDDSEYFAKSTVMPKYSFHCSQRDYLTQILIFILKFENCNFSSFERLINQFKRNEVISLICQQNVTFMTMTLFNFGLFVGNI